MKKQVHGKILGDKEQVARKGNMEMATGRVYHKEHGELHHGSTRTSLANPVV